jgi:hypothetical protein
MQLDSIYFCLLKARVGHPMCVVAIIGENDETGAVFVETAHRFKIVELLGEQLIDGGSIPLSVS